MPPPVKDALKNFAICKLYGPTLTAAARTPGDRWALALGAMYGRIHHYGSERLAPQGLVRGMPMAVSTAYLKRAWGVQGHDEAIAMLDWLAQRGHRLDPQFAAPGDHEALQDLLAWDMARCVNVARHAFHALHIGETEAWHHIRRAARIAQQAYPSWRDYGRRYLRGFMRWNGERDKKLDAAIDYLLKHPKSPWVQLHWQTSLDAPAGEMMATAR